MMRMLLSALLSGFVVVPSAVAGLVGYYPFDGDPLDHSGNENHGTAFGAIPVPGIRGGAYLLSTPADYIDLNTLVNCVAPFSVAIWIRPTKANGVARIVSTWSGLPGEGGFEIHYNTEQTPAMHFRLYRGGINCASADQPVILDQWQHVVAVWDGTRASIFLNGLLSESTIASASPRSSSLSVKVGAEGDLAARDQDFTGDVDDLWIYDEALSQGDVLDLYFRSGSLIAYYPFDEDAADHSGNENHGTVFGAASVPGIRGNAYSLSTAADYIDLNTVIDPLQPFSIALWIRPTKPSGIARLVSTWSGLAGEGGLELHYNTVHSPPMHFRLYREGVNCVSADQDMLLGEWQHVVAVWDGTNGSIFLNGELSERVAADAAPFPSSATVKIGAVADLVARNEDYEGAVDEVWLYGRALSADEVMASYRWQDGDRDGLPTWWELTFGLSPTSSQGDDGAGGDPDHDGFNNAQEFAAGTDPRAIDLRLLRAAEVCWHSAWGTHYRIYRSETLGAGAHWEPVSGIVEGTGMYMCILDSIYDRPAGEDSVGTPIPAAFYKVEVVE